VIFGIPVYCGMKSYVKAKLHPQLLLMRIYPISQLFCSRMYHRLLLALLWRYSRMTIPSWTLFQSHTWYWFVSRVQSKYLFCLQLSHSCFSGIFEFCFGLERGVPILESICFVRRPRSRYLVLAREIPFLYDQIYNRQFLHHLNFRLFTSFFSL